MTGGSVIRLVLPSAAWALGLAVFALAVSAREFGVLRFWLPENKRLVPEHVTRHGPFFGPLQFGFEMGTGMRTYVPSGLPHLLALCVVLLASPWAALGAGLGFAAGRSLMTLANLRYDGEHGWDLKWLSGEKVIKAILLAAMVVPLAVVLAHASGV
ncbi:hypothetical protein [Nonomuraea turcica]|uniref:hypothetical protein n=1 Tax=Nonomuraea sp. G32 TaxID=3067274 RepID=UPI00273C162C|nr:hypothetical protein [Nonomuraea sp. G32]MDP4506848.1 hypothetical protein [Nonomuraea sp. G32]